MITLNIYNFIQFQIIKINITCSLTLTQNHLATYSTPQAGNMASHKLLKWLGELVHHTAINEPGAVNAAIGMQVSSSLYSIWYLQTRDT